MTLIPFTPIRLNLPPFQAVVTLDGTAYNLTCIWNLFRAGWYFVITDQSGTVIYTGPLVGSPTTSDIFLAPGIFSVSTILYRSDTGNFEITP